MLERAVARGRLLPSRSSLAALCSGSGRSAPGATQAHGRDDPEGGAQLFERLPAPLWAERARRELARIGGRRVADGALTETERRVVELVAAGRSNNEVARELVVSTKTVEWNLSKVYRKLGVRSRAELAARVAGQI